MLVQLIPGEWRFWKAPAQGGPAVPVSQTVEGAAFESADEKYVYIATLNFSAGGSRPGSLFRVSAAGGEEALIAPTILNCNAFSVTARGVYFMQDARTLEFFDPATGKINTIATLDQHAVISGISVSPDDAYMIYSQADRRGSDIMVVENFR